MKIQYASDLHLEFQENRAWLLEHGLRPVGDILVQAGDIAHFGDKQLLHNEYFDSLSDNYEQVLIVPGNHEYYGGYELRDTLTNFEMEVRPNVKYLNNKSIVIGDTELFFTILWSKVPNAYIADIQNGMMDTRLICYKNALLFAGEYNELYNICAGWLKEAVESSKAKHKVVVTHHCPTFNPAFNGYPGSRLNCGFMVDCDDFIAAHDLDAWIFGHTHYNGGSGTVIGSTRLHTNQLGYVRDGEQKGFNPQATILLGDKDLKAL